MDRMIKIRFTNNDYIEFTTKNWKEIKELIREEKLITINDETGFTTNNITIIETKKV